MLKKVKRLICCVLLLVIIFPFVGQNVVYATPNSELYKTAVLNHLDELNDDISSTSTGQYGLLIRLKAISEYAGYVYYLTCNALEFNVSDEECMVYINNFKLACDSFNEDFGIDSSLYASLLLSSDAVCNITSFNSYVSTTLYVTDVVPYLNSMYADLQTKYNSSELTEFKRNYGVTCETMHRFVQDLLILQSDIDSLTYHTHVTLGYVDSLNTLIQDYSELYTYGGKLQAQLDSTNGSITVNSSAYPVENLATVTVSSYGVEVPADPQLTLAYIAIVSASAVYTPLESYAGDPEFIVALKSLAGDEDTAAELINLYNSTKSFKKPLYKRSLSTDGVPTGPAKLITLEDFFEAIQNGNTGSLCTVKGEFKCEADSWQYVVYKPTDTMVNLEVNLDPITEDTDYSPTSTQTIDVNGTGGQSTTLNQQEEVRDSVLSTIKPVFGEVHATTVDTGLSTTTIENVTEESGGKSVEADNIQSVEYARDTITTDESLTDALFLYGAKYARETDNLTTLILNNIICSAANLSSISQYEDGYLYVNAFGDIVTADDLIVFPGACNPLIYSDDVEYNLFSVAFMNSYPSILQNTSYFKVASRADIGKYLILGGYDSATGVVTGYKAAKIESIQGVKSTAPISVPSLKTSFSANKGLDSMKVFATRRLIFGDTDHWNEKNQFWSYIPLVYSSTMTVDGKNAFPYVRDEDEDYTVACAIAANAYDYLTIDEESSEVGNQHRINDNYVLNYFLIQGLNGTLDATGYEDDVALSYKQYTETSGERRLQALETSSEGIFDNTTSVSGVIGIQNTYQDPVFGKLFQLLKDYWWVFMLFVSLIILYAFSKIHLDLLQAIITFLLSMFTVYAFVWLIPAVFPSVYNIITNNVAQNLTYEVLGVKAEYADAYALSATSLTERGQNAFATTSITLYRVPSSQVQEFRDSLGAENDDLVGGNTVTINAEAGVFAEGDAIKVNTGVLFNTLKITGTVDASTASYQLHSTKTVSSNIDYYVPYYEMVDCFISKLNTLSGIYAIPRHTTMYANGKSKDNYLVYSYVNSKPFLTPGEYGLSIPGSELDWTQEELTAYQTQGVALETALTNAFGRNADWLGISDLLYNLSDAEKKTLWAHTMQNNGYYDASWVVNTEKMDELITYVNYQTRRFVYEMDSQIGKISDDVLIKLISMRALIALTQKASEFGNWLYPFTLNYEELTLGDVLNCVFISDYDKYISMEMQVVPYMMEEYGWLHLVVFDVLVILMFVNIHVIHFAVPLLYLLLGILIVFKIIRLGDVKSVFKGYLKTSFLIFMCSVVFTVSIVLARKINGSIFSLYFLLLMMLLITFVVVTVITSILFNFSNLGNDTINARLKAPFEHVKNVVQHTRFNSSKTYVNPGVLQTQKKLPNHSIYDFDSSVDDLYDNNTSYHSLDGDEKFDEVESLMETDSSEDTFSDVSDLDDASQYLFDDLEDEN